MGKHTVLHVEDDLDAAFFLKRAVEKATLDLDFRQLKDGEEALKYLNGDNPFADRNSYPLPEMILLDLKMPLVDGFEVLSWIKQKPDLSSIPVVILTSSDREEDLHRAKSLGASSFLTKSVTFGSVIQLLQTKLGPSS